jgi:TRAP-type C4-dicarboxylate transport system permease small subunit
MPSLIPRITRTLERTISWLFLLIAVLVTVLVILRYFFRTTIIGGQEFISFCFIYTTAVGAAVALAKGEQITIRVFLDILPGSLRPWVERIGHLLVAVLNGALVVLSIPWILSVGYFPSPVLRVPQGLVLVSLPIGCGLVCVYAILRMLGISCRDDDPQRKPA